MPYLRGSKLSDAQRATIKADTAFIDDHIWFVCLDGSVSRRHVPRQGPLDDHDIDLLLIALRHYETSPWRDMLGPQGTTSEHVAAVMQYIEGLKQ